MTKEPVSTAANNSEHVNPHKLLTSELRQNILRLKQQIEEYAILLDSLCHNLESIKVATSRAEEFAQCLLTDNLSEAWRVIQRSHQVNEWDPDDQDDLDRPLGD
jgi:hypothetical protein